MPTVSDRIVTIPNLLSFFRLLLIPVFLVLLVNGQYIWALVVLVGSSLTDFVDGYVARHFNQVTPRRPAARSGRRPALHLLDADRPRLDRVHPVVARRRDLRARVCCCWSSA